VGDDQQEGGEKRVRIGSMVLVRDEDNVRTTYIVTDARCVDALRRRFGQNVLTTRSLLGRTIYNAKAGDRREFRSNGEVRAVWIEGVKSAPSLQIRAEGSAQQVSLDPSSAEGPRHYSQQMPPVGHETLLRSLCHRVAAACCMALRAMRDVANCTHPGTAQNPRA
jgi:hypothetical protein